MRKIFSFSLIAIVCSLFIFQAHAGNTSKQHIPPSIIFIHGWNPVDYNYEYETGRLQQIFPGSKITFLNWSCSSKHFIDWMDAAEQEVKNLADKLAAMPTAERENTILTGHSLGGRIAIKTMAILAGRGLRIRQGIFLGAAIADNDPDISPAISASRQPNLNFYNRRDYILRHFFLGHRIKYRSREFALGSYGYAYPCLKKQMLQIKVADDAPAETELDYLASLEAHQLANYLEELAKFQNDIPHLDDNETDNTTADSLPGTPSPLQAPKFIKDILEKYTKKKNDTVYLFVPLEFGTEIDREKNWTLRQFKISFRGKETILYAVFDSRDRMTSWHFSSFYAQRAFDSVRNALRKL